MVTIIFCDVFVILLTIIGFLAGTTSVFFPLVASALVIIGTYYKLKDDKNGLLAIVFTILQFLFCIFSSSYYCFLIFFLLPIKKPIVRGVIGLLSYLVYGIVTRTPFSGIMIHLLILLALFIGLVLMNTIYDKYLSNSTSLHNALISSSASELHSKQFSEILLRKKASDEINLRLIERENISRDIHNSVGHSITAAIMTLDAADALFDVDPQKAREKMNDANSRIRGALENIRGAVRILDAENKPALSSDLKQEIMISIREIEMNQEITVRMHMDELDDNILIPKDHISFLVGAIKEIITNGLKHGHARVFFLELNGDSSNLKLLIKDNGEIKIDNNELESKLEEGFGLKKISSYVSRYGGKTKYIIDNGFKTTIELPIGL